MAALPRLPLSPGDRESSGGVCLAEITDDLRKLINFSIRTVCDRAVVGEAPRRAGCKLDIVDGCYDDATCEDDLIGFVLTVRKHRRKKMFF